MYKIVSVKPMEGFKVSLKFSDGVEGVVDLSDLKGEGVFEAWNDKEFFNAVSIDPESNTIAWPNGIDLCPDTLYAEITGIEIESLFNSKKAMVK
jgi:hypothetical protein